MIEVGKEIKHFGIEALSKHKEICSYLIDHNITFHCYNGGLKMINIEKLQPLVKHGFIDEIVEKFGLKEARRGKDTIYFE